MTLQEMINDAARRHGEDSSIFCRCAGDGCSGCEEMTEILAKNDFLTGANFILPLLEAEQAKLKIAVDALRDIKSEVGTSTLAAKFVNDALDEIYRVGVEK